MSRGSRREQDERALRILSMRKTMTCVEISEELGIVCQGISRICRDVVDADQAHPDPSATLADYREAYPWVK